ncbi:MAG: GGDEF domain-containing protein [Candidatus Acidiferrales bacterium]
MPQPGAPSSSQPSSEDSFLDLLVDTLDGLEESARGQFLQRFFRNISQLELSDTQSLEYWSEILRRRQAFAESLGKPVSLKTAMLDVLASNSQMRVPVLMEYDEFKKLQINAATDALTGLYNRRLFDEYCDKELNRARRYTQNLAVVILDLHRLKEVNDQHGHLKGDQVLQLAAATLRKTMRASDFAFRIGGDEFALLLPQTDPEQAITLCRRVRAQYETETRPLHLDIAVALDFGVAVHPQDGEEKDTLLRLADERLYQLKHSSRSQPRVIPLESQPPREAPVAAPSPKPAVVPPPATSAAPHPAPGAERRKWERVSLAGTRAYAALTETAQKTGSVIDLSYGGVALSLEKPEELPNQFYATLHVPILPPVRVSLRKAYTLKGEGGRTRVGCAFVS